jgi:hypothetical protein
MSRNFSVGDFIEFSGYYEKYIDSENNEIIMSSSSRAGIVLEIKSNYARVFSENNIYIVNLSSDSITISPI